MPYSIMLDAGHGGRDPGAVYNGRQEKIDTLSLTLAIGQILQERGIDVLYTRTTDIYESPYQKAMEANEAGVDISSLSIVILFRKITLSRESNLLSTTNPALNWRWRKI